MSQRPATVETFGGQLRLQAAGVDVPYQLLLMLPYVLTIAALLVNRKRTQVPLALRIPTSEAARADPAPTRIQPRRRRSHPSAVDSCDSPMLPCAARKASTIFV
jgi:hypothetical protein